MANKITKRNSFIEFMLTQIELLQDSNRFGTAQNYKSTLNSFNSFLNYKDVSFKLITSDLIESYNAYLIKRNISRNSISFYMRVLRSVYNKAVKHKLTKNLNPFDDVYTGVDKTTKRAVDEGVISQLCTLRIKDGSALELARDIFMFSYFARGMAFVDIAFLTKKDIRNNRILYRRHKTKQLLDIKIENSIKEIIDKYKGQSDLYVFPIISSCDAEEAYKQYQSAINKYNRLLVILSRKINNDIKLTSYVARHSWATAARKHNIPISIISAGLGHSNETTTQIYLTGIENSLIDKANTILIKNLKR